MCEMRKDTPKLLKRYSIIDNYNNKNNELVSLDQIPLRQNLETICFMFGFVSLYPCFFSTRVSSIGLFRSILGEKGRRGIRSNFLIPKITK